MTELTRDYGVPIYLTIRKSGDLQGKDLPLITHPMIDHRYRKFAEAGGISYAEYKPHDKETFLGRIFQYFNFLAGIGIAKLKKGDGSILDPPVAISCLRSTTKRACPHLTPLLFSPGATGICRSPTALDRERTWGFEVTIHRACGSQWKN